MKFLISKQTEAENDKYIFDCFYESSFINDLLDNDFSIISGRKGSGKTALAKFIQKKHIDYNIFFAKRISIDEICHDESVEHSVEGIILFIIIKSVKILLEKKEILTDGAEKYWKDFLTENGLQEIDDFKTFTKWKKEYSAVIKYKNFKIGGESEYRKTNLSDSSSYLFSSFRQSLRDGFRFFVFVDDMTDYLDRVSPKNLKKQLYIIRDVILLLDKFNSNAREEEKDFRFISCIRDDVLDFLEGSNINKLKNNCLELKWDEKAFCNMLIKRLPLTDEEIILKSHNYIKSIEEIFPNEIFVEFLRKFNTKRFHTNFYAYINAITFNRPRDFLKFCFVLNKRVSDNKKVEIKHIDSSEIEYSDYFIKELKDELYLSSQLLNFKADSEGLNGLIKILASKNNFGVKELKSEVSHFLNKKASNRVVTDFINNLWLYGIIGFRGKDENELINFRYMDDSFKFSMDQREINNLIFFLHRGMYWSYKKKVQFKQK